MEVAQFEVARHPHVVAADVDHGEDVHERVELDVVIRAGVVRLDDRLAGLVLIDVHEQVERLVDGVGRDAELALRLDLDLLAVRVLALPEEPPVQERRAVWDEGVRLTRVAQDRQHRALPRRPGPHQVPVSRALPVEAPSPTEVHVLVPVVQGVDVEVRALPALDLLDPQE